jgi:hypothetical protein
VAKVRPAHSGGIPTFKKVWLDILHPFKIDFAFLSFPILNLKRKKGNPK